MLEVKKITVLQAACRSIWMLLRDRSDVEALGEPASLGLGPGNACCLHMRYGGRVTLFSSSNSVNALVASASANVRAARQGAG
jgi:hypothetical protein